MQRFESLLLPPAIILGTPAVAGLNQKNSTSSRLCRDSGLRQLLIFDAPLQQASLSQNAQWRSQKPFNCNSFDSYFWDTTLARHYNTSALQTKPLY